MLKINIYSLQEGYPRLKMKKKGRLNEGLNLKNVLTEKALQCGGACVEDQVQERALRAPPPPRPPPQCPTPLRWARRWEREDYELIENSQREIIGRIDETTIRKIAMETMPFF